MEFKKSLPIGSIVTLKGMKRKVMIFGYKQKGHKNNEKIFDYVGVVYPEGHIDSRLHLGFDHININEVVFNGYFDDEREEFANLVDNFKE